MLAPRLRALQDAIARLARLPKLSWRGRRELPPRPETRLGRLVYECAVLGRCGRSIVIEKFELREVEEVAGLRGFEQLLRCLLCGGNLGCKAVRVTTRSGEGVEAPLFTCVCYGGEHYARQCSHRQILVEMHGKPVLLEISDVPP